MVRARCSQSVYDQRSFMKLHLCLQSSTRHRHEHENLALHQLAIDYIALRIRANLSLFKRGDPFLMFVLMFVLSEKVTRAILPV